MPCEVAFQIISQLLPDEDLFGWPETIATDLHSLCLKSKYLSQVATALLYEIVVPRRFFPNFVITVLQSATLAQLIKHIVLFGTNVWAARDYARGGEARQPVADGIDKMCLRRLPETAMMAIPPPQIHVPKVRNIRATL